MHVRRPKNWDNVTDTISGRLLTTSGREFRPLHEWQELIQKNKIERPRAGDIILLQARKSKNLVVLAQEAIGYPDSAAKVTHAALYTGNGKICDADLYGGVKIRKVTDAFADCLISFVRPEEVSESEGQQAALWAVNQVGQRYSPAEALRVIAGRLKYLRADQGAMIGGAAEQFVFIADRVLRILSERGPRSDSWDLYNASLNEQGILAEFLADEGLAKQFICSSLVSDAFL